MTLYDLAQKDPLFNYYLREVERYTEGLKKVFNLFYSNNRNECIAYIRGYMRCLYQHNIITSLEKDMLEKELDDLIKLKEGETQWFT